MVLESRAAGMLREALGARNDAHYSYPYGPRSAVLHNIEPWCGQIYVKSRFKKLLPSLPSSRHLQSRASLFCRGFKQSMHKESDTFPPLGTGSAMLMPRR